MHAPVIQHPAAFTDMYMPVMHISVKSIQAALDGVHLSQRALVKNLLRRAEIPVQPALMVYRKFYAALFCHADHIIQLFQAHCDGLLTDDVLSCPCGLEHQVMMLVIICRDQYHLYLRIPEQFFI